MLSLLVVANIQAKASDLIVCNKSAHIASVAAAYVWLNGTKVTTSARIWGWYTLQIGECRTLITASKPLPDTEHFYVSARATDGSYTWSGAQLTYADPAGVRRDLAPMTDALAHVWPVSMNLCDPGPGEQTPAKGETWDFNPNPTCVESLTYSRVGQTVNLF
jgi:hypothetical protein